MVSAAPFHSPFNGSYNTRGKQSGRNVFGNFTNDFQSCIFTMEEILRATKNFSPGLKIGQGGFGTVFKGTLDDGTLVAVKRAKRVRINSSFVNFMKERYFFYWAARTVFRFQIHCCLLQNGS